MKRSLHFISVALVAILLTTGCYNAIEQQLQYGDYDAVLKTSLERISKSRKRDEYINTALKAYNNVMADDRYRIGQLKAQNSDGRNWGKIYYLYDRMESRQRAITPYLPLTYLNGDKADVELFDFGPVTEEARLNAAEYHYQRARAFLNEGTRQSARYAFSEMDNIAQFQYNYKDAQSLAEQALELGTNKVYLKFNKVYEIYLPDAFTDELSYYDYEAQMGSWSKLYRQMPDTGIIDYTIELKIERLDLSPQLLKENHYTLEKEVEDGHQPLVDHEGNYVTDTSGNIIQVPKFKTLTCHITEWSQNRTATVITGFNIYDMRKDQLIAHQDLEEHSVFENLYARANGHLNILSPEVIHKLESSPKPFPNDLEMIMLTSNGLKRLISHAIQRHQYILEGV